LFPTVKLMAHVTVQSAFMRCVRWIRVGSRALTAVGTSIYSSFVVVQTINARGEVHQTISRVNIVLHGGRVMHHSLRGPVPDRLALARIGCGPAVFGRKIGETRKIYRQSG
jgi:hypothetical protein